MIIVFFGLWCVLGPLPDDLIIFQHFPDTVKRNGDQFAHFVFELKREVVSFFKEDLFKRYVHIVIQHMIFVANDKLSFTEFFVPPDPVEQVYNAYHVIILKAREGTMKNHQSSMPMLSAALQLKNSRTSSNVMCHSCSFDGSNQLAVNTLTYNASEITRILYL